MKPHRTDGLSLTFGLVFLASAGLWLLARLVNLNAATVGWLIAVGLVILGGLGIAHAVVAAERRRHTATPSQHGSAEPLRHPEDQPQ